MEKEIVKMRTRQSVSNATSPKSLNLDETKSYKSEIDELKDILIKENKELKMNIRKLLDGQSSMQVLINSLVKDNQKKDVEIEKLTRRVDDLEQYTRREDIVISGLKTKHQSYARAVSSQGSAESNENAPNGEQQSLESQVIDFLDTMNINVAPEEVSACHTLKPKNSASPPLIVMRFVNRKSKVRVMRNAALNRNGLRQNRVYLNDHLTSKNASIFRQARDLLRKGLILGTWTRNCSVFVKFLDDSQTKVITVREISQLSQFTTTKDGGTAIS